MVGFSELWVHPKTFSERRAAAMKYNPAELDRAGVIVDGRQSKARFNRIEADAAKLTRTDYYCYKLKTLGLNTQMAFVLPNWIASISTSGPGADCCDVNQMNRDGFFEHLIGI
jgi:hypothetical protein